MNVAIKIHSVDDFEITQENLIYKHNASWDSIGRKINKFDSAGVQYILLINEKLFVTYSQITLRQFNNEFEIFDNYTQFDRYMKLNKLKEYETT